MRNFLRAPYLYAWPWVRFKSTAVQKHGGGAGTHKKEHRYTRLLGSTLYPRRGHGRGAGRARRDTFRDTSCTYSGVLWSVCALRPLAPWPCAGPTILDFISIASRAGAPGESVYRRLLRRDHTSSSATLEKNGEHKLHAQGGGRALEAVGVAHKPRPTDAIIAVRVMVGASSSLIAAVRRRRTVTQPPRTLITSAPVGERRREDACEEVAAAAGPTQRRPSAVHASSDDPHTIG